MGIASSTSATIAISGTIALSGTTAGSCGGTTATSAVGNSFSDKLYNLWEMDRANGTTVKEARSRQRPTHRAHGAVDAVICHIVVVAQHHALADVELLVLFDSELFAPAIATILLALVEIGHIRVGVDSSQF